MPSDVSNRGLSFPLNNSPSSILVWETLRQWKSLSTEVLDPVQKEFDEATKDLTQEWVGAQPNDWGFTIGSEHTIGNGTGNALNIQLCLTVLALLQFV